jgi:hypothetical protein
MTLDDHREWLSIEREGSIRVPYCHSHVEKVEIVLITGESGDLVPHLSGALRAIESDGPQVSIGVHHIISFRFRASSKEYQFRGPEDRVPSFS